MVVEVNSETDFVARNEAFQAIVRNTAQVALTTDGSVEAVGAATYPDGGKSVVDTIKDAVGKIGENMALRRSAMLSVGEGVVATYIHNQVTEGLGKLGVLVAMESTGDKTALNAFGRQVAMHVAADQSAGAQRRRDRPGGDRAREGDLFRAGSPVGQAGCDHIAASSRAIV